MNQQLLANKIPIETTESRFFQFKVALIPRIQCPQVNGKFLDLKIACVKWYFTSYSIFLNLQNIIYYENVRFRTWSFLCIFNSNYMRTFRIILNFFSFILKLSLDQSLRILFWFHPFTLWIFCPSPWFFCPATTTNNTKLCPIISTSTFQSLIQADLSVSAGHFITDKTNDLHVNVGNGTNLSLERLYSELLLKQAS